MQKDKEETIPLAEMVARLTGAAKSAPKAQAKAVLSAGQDGRVCDLSIVFEGKEEVLQSIYAALVWSAPPPSPPPP